ncbi:MAG: hypothetical protein JWO53_410 [Chlamydiia bacterium]|nr:hypothetical protein [Chlamydiia bacterium]
MSLSIPSQRIASITDKLTHLHIGSTVNGPESQKKSTTSHEKKVESVKERVLLSTSSASSYQTRSFQKAAPTANSYKSPASLTIALKSASSENEIFEIWKKNQQKYDTAHIACTFNRLSHLGVSERNYGVFDDLYKILLKNVKNLRATQIAIIANAFAKLDCSYKELFKLFEELIIHSVEASALLTDLKPQELANIANAFAKFGFGSEALFTVLGQEVLKRDLRGFKPQDLAVIAHAFAKLGFGSAQLFTALEQGILKSNLRDFEPVELANIANAFAKTGFGSAQLFIALEKDILNRKLNDFSPQHLANIAWSLVVSGHHTSPLLGAIITFVSEKVEERNNLNIIFVSGKVEKRNNLKFKELFLERERTQFLQVYTALSFTKAQKSFAWGSTLVQLVQETDSNLQVTKQVPPSTHFHLSIAKALSRLGIKYENEKYVKGFFIDILADIQGSKIAIDANGLFHYHQNSHTLDGQSRFKMWYLEQEGYPLSIVPYWEWDALKGDSHREDKYMTSLIATIQSRPMLQLEEKRLQKPTKRPTSQMRVVEVKQIQKMLEPNPAEKPASVSVSTTPSKIPTLNVHQKIKVKPAQKKIKAKKKPLISTTDQKVSKLKVQSRAILPKTSLTGSLKSKCLPYLYPIINTVACHVLTWVFMKVTSESYQSK